MSIRRKKILFILSFCMAGMFLQAQDVRVKATANRDRILIGEPVILQFEAEFPPTEEISWFTLDSIPHFDIIEKGKMDTLKGLSGKLYKQLISVTSFDSGTWVIPRYSIRIGENNYLTDSIKIDIIYSPADPSQPYHDIKDIIDVPAFDSLYINYFIVVLTLVAIAALIYLLRKKRQAAPAVVVQKGPVLTPYEKARTSLEALKLSGIEGKGQIKQYYIQLNDILRNYFRDLQLVTSPDCTNDQLIMRVKPLLEKEPLVELAQALRLADAVKFAKYLPSKEENEQVFTGISNSIDLIEKQINKSTAA
jgi:hypothetical protein